MASTIDILIRSQADITGLNAAIEAMDRLSTKASTVISASFNTKLTQSLSLNGVAESFKQVSDAANSLNQAAETIQTAANSFNEINNQSKSTADTIFDLLGKFDALAGAAENFGKADKVFKLRQLRLQSIVKWSTQAVSILWKNIPNRLLKNPPI